MMYGGMPAGGMALGGWLIRAGGRRFKEALIKYAYGDWWIFSAKNALRILEIHKVFLRIRAFLWQKISRHPLLSI